MRRYLFHQIQSDLKKKMVFVGGPRQVGKTTLARAIVPSEEAYLSWDVRQDRERILLQQWPRGPSLVFLTLAKP